MGYVIVGVLAFMLGGILAASRVFYRLRECAETGERVPLYGRWYLLIPADDVGGELWKENHTLRVTLGRIREVTRRSEGEVADDDLANQAVVASTLDDQIVLAVCEDLAEVRLIIAEADEVF